MITDCRLVVLSTIQRLLTRCYGSAVKREEACEDSEGGSSREVTARRRHPMRYLLRLQGGAFLLKKNNNKKNNPKLKPKGAQNLAYKHRRSHLRPQANNRHLNRRCNNGGMCARVTSAFMERNDPDSAFPLYIGRICAVFFACGANTPTEAAVARANAVYRRKWPHSPPISQQHPAAAASRYGALLFLQSRAIHVSASTCQ
jgi:hypothetical protein